MIHKLTKLGLSASASAAEATVLAGGRRLNTIRTEALGAGTYGTIFQSATDKIVYKKIVTGVKRLGLNKVGEELKNRIKFLNNIEYNLRTIFLELFIQIVLSSDTAYGVNICRPITLFSTANIPKLSEGALHGNPTIGDCQNVALYIRMEKISHTFPNYLKSKAATTGNLIKREHLQPIFYQLGMTLHHMYETYEFRHGDLHEGNLMVDEDAAGNPIVKIIDFGMSCIRTYAGSTSRAEVPRLFQDYVDREKTACRSFDLLIFFTSLYGRYAGPEHSATASHPRFESAFGTEMKALFDLPAGTADIHYAPPDTTPRTFRNVYEYLATKANGGTVFHQAYDWEINHSIRAKLNTIPALKPLQFANLFHPSTTAALPAPAPVPGPLIATATRSAGVGRTTGAAAAAASSAPSTASSTSSTCERGSSGWCCRRPTSSKKSACVIMGGARHSRTSNKSRMKSRRSSTRRQSGAGYLTPAEFFGGPQQPAASGWWPAPSTAPTSTMVRQPLFATTQAGGSRRRRTLRKLRGGFSPTVMGGFIPNAQAAIVPAALYLAYDQLVRKNGAKSMTKGLKKAWKKMTSRRR